MTTPAFSKTLIAIVNDLSNDLSSKIRYQRLLSAMKTIFPCNATVILKLEGKILKRTNGGKTIAKAVFEQAIADGVAMAIPQERMDQAIEANFWQPEYRSYRRVSF